MLYRYLPHGSPVPRGWKVISKFKGCHHQAHSVLIARKSRVVSSKGIVMTTRKCTKCGHARPIDQFGTRSDNGKPHSWCRDCKRAYDRTAVALKRTITSKSVKIAGMR